MFTADILSLAGLRIDGRRCNEIRTIKHNLNVDKCLATDGSIYYEQGLNKLCVSIIGPYESNKKMDLAINEKGRIICDIYQQSNSITSIHKKRFKHKSDKRTMEMEKIIEQTLSSVIMVEYYIKSDIHIEVTVLEKDGSLICCILNAICIALIQSGILMNDIILSCSAGLTSNKMICCDVTQLEESNCYFPIAIKSRTKEIIFMELDARISLDRLQEALDVAMIGCEKIGDYITLNMKEYVIECLEKQQIS